MKIRGDPDFPMNRGYICIKGVAYHEFVHHPNRLKYPMKRISGRGEGKWERITWDKALNEIAEKLTEIRSKYGPESIASIHGTGPRPTLYSTALLTYALGSPNVASVDLHICFAPSIVAEVCTYGKSIMMERGPDYANSNCIMVWGGNPLVSHPPRGIEILEAKRRRRAKIIVIDPYSTRLAKEADLWLQIRPGTDLALALGMIKVIIEEELYDREFVRDWCYGFDKLKEHVEKLSLERISEVTWIPASTIREASRMYSTTKPAVLHHRVAVEHSINSTQTCRALAILIALTGNIDVKGGNLLVEPLEGFVGDSSLMGMDGGEFRLGREIEEKRIGADRYPLISGPEAPLPFVNPLLLMDTLLTDKPYPVKALICAGGNPIINIQNSRRVWEALRRLELLVVIDFFMTPTAELADYVLPASMWPERDECCDLRIPIRERDLTYMSGICARRKVVEPPYECWHDMKISIELVKRIPWANRKFIPWNSVEEFNEWRIRNMGITFEEFKERKYMAKPIRYEKYKYGGFKTPTGKVELYSTIFEKYGYDPLPIYVEPPESPISTPELLKEYPYILVTGSRSIVFFHSEGRQIPSLRRVTPDPEVEIHPDTALKLNVKNGDWVWIETPQIKGVRVKFKVRVTSNVHPMVLHARHGWWYPEKAGLEHRCFESNINVIISDTLRERICGSVTDRGTLCKVYRVSS